MPVTAAYLSIVLIWSTSPLAIKWGSEGPGFITSVTTRMLIGLALCWLLVKILRIPLRWCNETKIIYTISGINIYGAMMFVYWGAQYIPSGLVAVTYGLTPLIMGISAALWLPGSRFTFNQMLGALMGLMGLIIIFVDALRIDGRAVQGVLAVLISVIIHCLCTVWIKRQNSSVHPLSITTGGLLIAAPLFLFTWILGPENLNGIIPASAVFATVYLAVFGTVIGWALYFYVLKKISASSIALVTLMTPVLALLIGMTFNREEITARLIVGTTVIIVGISLHQWGASLALLVRQTVRKPAP